MFKLTLLILLTLTAEARIIGGSVVQDPASVAPFFVRVGEDCGGTVINQSFVLTAAHCTYRFVYLNRLPSLTLMNGTKLTPLKIVPHPRNTREGGTLRYDFSLIQFAEKLGPEHILALQQTELVAGDELSVFGFGVFDLKRPRHSEALRTIVEQFIPREVANHPDSYGGRVEAEMIAAGFPGGLAGACQGDSGGPLVNTKVNPPELVGVVSWGEDCAKPLKYSIYASPLAEKDWIDETIRSAN